MRREGRVEVGVEDARFDDGDQVVGAHLEDAVHAAHREGDLAVAGVRGTREARTGAAGHDGGAGGGGDAQGRLHVLDRAGVHDRDGDACCGVPGLVGPSGTTGVEGDVDAIAELGGETGDDLDGVGHDRRRRPTSTPHVTAITAKTTPIHA